MTVGEMKTTVTYGTLIKVTWEESFGSTKTKFGIFHGFREDGKTFSLRIGPGEYYTMIADDPSMVVSLVDITPYAELLNTLHDLGEKSGITC